MITNIFVNLPVKDLDRSMEFFRKLGFVFNPQFTDNTAACLVISDNIYAMLLTHDKFREFNKSEIADPEKFSEVIVAVSTESRNKVDEFADIAVSSGGKKAGEATDHGFMYSRSFRDPDGHMWEVLWMDPDHVNQESVTSDSEQAKM